ncbi:MAG TPA: metal ABC transporter permease [Dongiaceae bacterium]|nr:metal ABC transporter permease [Dongiaceae bacterium]
MIITTTIITQGITMIELLLPALLIGLLLAVIAGPLGCFVVWGRMAYFGDTLAHSALLGIALGFLFSLNLSVGVIIVTSGIALALTVLQGQRFIASDTLLGIMAHGTLALGLVLVSLMDHVRVDLLGLLFGDLLATTFTDVAWVGALALIILVALRFIWLPMLNIAVNQELAQAEGTRVGLVRLLFLLLLASIVAIGMKVVGALLITAMLIIPAAAARKLSSTPEQMAVFASLIGVGAVVAGLLLSWLADTPAGPSIVLCAAVGFTLIYLLIPTKSS